ncbi:MAG: hypothetical protein ABI411_17605 [Tahibacter sp.]
MLLAIRTPARLLFATLALLSVAFAAQAESCGAKLLVSGYYSTVHIYDACSGAYLRNLDTGGRITGAQALRLGPDGRIWVVSESNGAILRYRADNFDFVDVFANVGTIGATGLDFAPNGDVYIGAYDTSSVGRYDAHDGHLIETVIPSQSVGLRGADNGLRFGPDGKLYVPGYSSNTVVRYDPVTHIYEGNYVPTGTGGLRRTRGLLFSADGESLYVGGEGSGSILRMDRASGALRQTVATGLSVPTGLAWHPDGSLLVAENDRVVKRDAQTGALRSVLVAPSSGGLAGSTFVMVLPDVVSTPPDAASIGSQYWISGLSTLNGSLLEISDAYTTLGTGFGAAFNPQQVRRINWGKIRMNFTSCTEADFSWDSTTADSAHFGSGGYHVYRILRNQASAACESGGISAAPNRMWAAGSWYGGEARSGEGLQLDVNTDGLVYLTWFTHRPASPD